MTREDPIRGDLIRKSFDELDVLGQALKEEMMAYIERRGNPLDKEHYYTLKELKIEFAEIFGEDAASLLVERLKRGIDVLKSLCIIIMPVAGLFLLTCST